MAKIEQTATVTTTEEVRLAPKLRQKLMTELRTYESLTGQIKVLEAARNKHKAAVDAIRDEIGEQSIKLAGYTVTLCAPTRKKFNEKRFVSSGGDLKLYQNAFDEVPVKAYTRISLPGEKADE